MKIDFGPSKKYSYDKKFSTNIHALSCRQINTKLTGIWSRYRVGGEGSKIRFYYFHGNGIGLYRYGKVGYTNTHSFDYKIKEDQLMIEFRKTGKNHKVHFRIETDAETELEWLILENDPRETKEGRYFRQSKEEIRQKDKIALNRFPGGRMWIQKQEYATGGIGFSMYQFRESGIDGRGLGWHHQGDFDNWSTESLSYRLVNHRIELNFELRQEKAASLFSVKKQGKNHTLTLQKDPRNFWHTQSFEDMGPSFGLDMALHVPPNFRPLFLR